MTPYTSIGLTKQEIRDAAPILLALKRVPAERRLDALVLAAKVLIERPEAL